MMRWLVVGRWRQIGVNVVQVYYVTCVCKNQHDVAVFLSMHTVYIITSVSVCACMCVSLYLCLGSRLTRVNFRCARNFYK